MRSVVVEQIARRLRLGQNDKIIIDAVRVASARLNPGTPIMGFGYFDKAIARAHDAVRVDPQLSLRLNGTEGMKKPIEGDEHGCDSIQDALNELASRACDIAGGT